MPSSPRNDKLFKRFPLIGEIRTSAGLMPVPYHVYDGRVVLIGGTAELGAVNELVQNEQLSPLRDTEGRALAAVWVCDFSDASLGPHRELQISIFVKREAIHPVASHPLAIHRALLTEDGVGMLCHGLWNDTNTAVVYNREVLGLPARVADATVAHDAAGITSFSFKLASTGRSIITGKIPDTISQPGDVQRMLTSVIGLKGVAKLLRQRELHNQVINPISKVIPLNCAADTFSSSKRQVLRLFDPAEDRIVIEDEAYQQFGFWPTFVQQMEGFRFVYLNPETWPGGPPVKKEPPQTRPTFQPF